MHSKITFSIAALLSLTSVACGPNEAEEARTWATSSSAPAVYWQIYEPVAVAQGEQTFDDAACPTTSDDGTVFTIRGECTTTEGQRRFGTATVTRGASEGDLAITLDGYGAENDLGEVRTSGTATITRRAADLHEFTLDLTVVGTSTTRVDYEGTVRGGYDGPTTWNGTGSIERTGFAPTGRVLATTLDERFDGTVCSGQPVSGSTTLMREGRTDVVTYDGATDCDMARAAQWSVNGASRGLLTDIACSARPGARSPLALAIALIAAVTLLLRRASRRS